MSYFWDPPGVKVGLNADIERHRERLAKLDADIAECECRTDAMSVAAMRTLRHLRAQLLQSLAEVTSQIGKKA